MNYCIYDVGNGKYFCDINNNLYTSYQDCYSNCGVSLNDKLIHISNVDLTFIFGIWAVLLAIGFFIAFHLSHD